MSLPRTGHPCHGDLARCGQYGSNDPGSRGRRKGGGGGANDFSVKSVLDFSPVLSIGHGKVPTSHQQVKSSSPSSHSFAVVDGDDGENFLIIQLLKP